MKIITFKYTDSKGKESKRVLLPSVQPANFYSGTDLSELNDEDTVEYVRRREWLHDAYLLEIDKLNKEMDVKYKYRKFLVENVKDLEEEDI